MPAAADLQAQIAAAMLTSARPGCATLLSGGDDPARRFAIHSRHYAASVARAIVERFTATVWLVGSAPIVRAAAAFVREHPPTGPCMAEYGERFPAFLESWSGDPLPAYVGQFATLDWHLGGAALACSAPAVTGLADCDPSAVADLRLALQDGLAYLPLRWPLDELMAFYLSGEAPESHTLAQAPLWLEVRGSRGDLSLQRLARGEFVFRAALARGATLGTAALAAIDADATFSPGAAVPRLLAEGLVTGVAHPAREGADDACRV